jgi:uncharacterized membrane protein YeiH
VVLEILQWVGLVAFAASGALVGVSKRLDLFGVCAVAAFTGVGGGVLRDVLLGITPPTSLSSWPVLGAVLGTALAVFALPPLFGRLRREVLILDALGMGLFASTGTAVALAHGALPLAACLVGATTAIGGGVLRDILVNEIPLLLHADLYAVPALVGSAMVAAAHAASMSGGLALIVGTVAATGLRLLALWRGWSLPKPRQL